MGNKHDLLYEIWFDPAKPAGYGSAQHLYKAAKLKDKSITLKYTKQFLAEEPVYGAFKLLTHRHNMRHYYVNAPDKEYEYDLIIFNRYVGFLFPTYYVAALLFIDCFSKMGYVEPVISRSALDVSAATAKILDRMPRYPESIRSDREKAFMSAELRKVCQDRNVKQTFTTRLPKGAMVERFIKTLKQKLIRAMTHHNNTRKKHGLRRWQWPTLLPLIIHAYNRTVSRAIGTTPMKAQLLKNRSKILKHRKKYWKGFPYDQQGKVPVYELGDQVRNYKSTV